MKRIVLAFMAAALLLTGCSKKEKDPITTPEETYNTAGERTVIYHGEKEFPLSFTTDGVQKIENGTYWYYELEKAYGKDWEDSFYTYDIKKLELTGTRSYSKLGKRSCFATNGNWPLFLNPVHTEYTSSNQNMVDSKLMAHAEQQLLANQMTDTPAIITDVWSCDMDGDGTQEFLFKACNYTLPVKEPKEENTVEKENIHTYCFLAYAKDDVCQVLSGSFRTETSEVAETTVALAPYTYDEAGNLSQTVLYQKDPYHAVQEMKPLICDLNGDGKWSLLLYRSGDYESFTAFDYSGGNFTKNYEIIF
mgnify:CR=1 FL=1